MREINKNLFGAEIIDRTCDIWGLDEEGELQGNFRPSGHPGVRVYPCNTSIFMVLFDTSLSRSSGILLVTSLLLDFCPNT